MNRFTLRPDHIEDYLVTVRKGQWFGWSPSSNKIYANLVVHDGGTKPTEKQCTDGLKALQDAWDLEYDSYKSKRRSSYDSLSNQLDMLYHDLVAGKLDATGTWAQHIKAVKDANPKP
jgi:hypothetical protein